MIKARNGKCEVDGRIEDIAYDLLMIFKGLIEELGREKVLLILTSVFGAIEELEKEEKIKTKEKVRSEIIKNLPNDVSKILLRLI